MRANEYQHVMTRFGRFLETFVLWIKVALALEGLTKITKPWMNILIYMHSEYLYSVKNKCQGNLGGGGGLGGTNEPFI